MDFQDKTLACKDCGKEFVWTADEQKFYQEKGFVNEPQRCPDCRRAKKQARQDTQGPRQMYPITCSVCGQPGEVPFEPRGDRPVQCKECFNKQRDGQAA